MEASVFSTPPPVVKNALLECPKPHVLLVTINRAKQMNCLNLDACWEFDSIWKWFDKDPELRVAIITGAGSKSFSAGMDLREGQTSRWQSLTRQDYPSSGFAGLTPYQGKKPIIAAVNGYAHGGGMEIAAHCDFVIASENATFCLPDVKRGTAALMGVLPIISRLFGMQRAMLMALTGYQLHAQEAKEWGLVYKVVPSKSLIKEALELAGVVASMSPDSVLVSRAGVREAWEDGSVENATRTVIEKYGSGLYRGENAKEGMKAFAEKRSPKWIPSKL